MLAKPFLFLLLFLLPAAAVPASAGIRALLVDLGETAPGSGFDSLPATPNDLELMKSLLVERFGASPSDIRVVRNSEATSQGIQKAFRSHLIESCREDDVTVFFVAGHGTQVPDVGPDYGDEDDHEDEAIITYDFDFQNPETWLNDDIIHHLLQQVPSRHILVLFDTCSSGTGTRDCRGIESPFDWKSLPGSNPVDVSMNDASVDERQLFISACKADEQAESIRDEVRDCQVGAFTYSFTQIASGPAADRPLRELSSLLQEKVKSEIDKYHGETAKNKRQTPQIESGRDDFSLSDFMKGRVYTGEAPVTETPLPEESPLTTFATGGDLKVTIETNQRSYVWTENLTATATVNRPAYLRIIHVDADGKQTQFFPNKSNQQRQVLPGETLHLPSPGRAIRVTNTSRPGLEMLIAIASTAPFTDPSINRFGDSTFNELSPAPIAETISRGISVEARPDSSYTLPTSGGDGTVNGAASVAQAVAVFEVSQFR